MKSSFFSHRMEDSNKLSSRLASSMSFFPSLCVVRSLPTLGHILSEEARERSFASLYEFRGHSRVKSGIMKKAAFNSTEDRYSMQILRMKAKSEHWNTAKNEFRVFDSMYLNIVLLSLLLSLLELYHCSLAM